MDMFNENETDLAMEHLQNYTTEFDNIGERCENRTVSMISTVLMGVISSSGFVLNSAVILIVIALREYKKTSHWYVLNLAFADAIFLVMLPLKIAENMLGRWSFGLPMCYAYNTVFYANYYAGIFFLTVMSFDRYVAIVHPVSARWRRFRSKEYSWFITGFVWVLAVTASLPLLLKTNATCICGFDFRPSGIDPSCADAGKTNQYECEIFLRVIKEMELEFPISGDGNNDKILEHIYGLDDDNTSLDDALQRTEDEVGDECSHPIKHRYFEVWIYCNFFVAFIAPVVIMSVCYSCILWRVLHPRIPSSKNNRFSIHGKKKDSAKIKKAQANGSFTNSNQRNNYRITVLVVSLVVIFILCWLPFHVWLIAKLFGFKMNGDLCKLLQSVTFLMACLNSLLNPIFYTFLGTHFRRRVKNVWNRVKFHCGSKRDVFTTFKYTKSKERGQNQRYPGTQTTKVNDSSYVYSGDPSNIQLRLLKSTKENESNAD